MVDTDDVLFAFQAHLSYGFGGETLSDKVKGPLANEDATRAIEVIRYKTLLMEIRCNTFDVAVRIISLINREIIGVTEA